MTAARSYPPPSQPSRVNKSRRTLRHPQSRSMNPSKVARLPKERTQLPQSLQFMLLIQKGSAAFTFFLVTITLAVYGWTVCAPTLWSQEFRKLNKLQRDERHLVGANESLKHQLAQQAQTPEAGLTQPHPSQSIFLEAAQIPPLSPIPVLASDSGKPFMAQAPVAY